MKNDNNFDFSGETEGNNEQILNDINYCCTKCLSLIKILSIKENKNIIEFECSNENNNHKVSITIEDYLKNRLKIKNNLYGNEVDLCKEHKEINKAYCFDCYKHLCEKCLCEGNHIDHSKINIIEIQPIQEELKIMEKIIDYYDDKIEQLQKTYISKSKKIKDLKKDQKKKINKIKNKKLKEIEDTKKKELKEAKEKYLMDIRIIKEKFEKDLKKLKNDYEVKTNKINNKYKLIKEKMDYIIIKRLVLFENKLKEKINTYELYKKDIENLTNLNTLNKLVYNTYNNHTNNAFNAINVNYFIKHYYETNDYIKNNIILKILNNNFNNKIKIIYRRTDLFGKLMNKPKKTRLIIKPKPYLIMDVRKPIHQVKTENSQMDVRKPNHQVKTENLFLLFNSIFFRNLEQTIFKDEKIDEYMKDFLSRKFFKYKNEKKEYELINYFDNFIKANVLKIFGRKYENNNILDTIKYNIKTILECFCLDSRKYINYYYKEKTDKVISDRKKSTEAAKKFRQIFNLNNSNIINEDELIRKLEKNDYDINKVFQQLYG